MIVVQRQLPNGDWYDERNEKTDSGNADEFDTTAAAEAWGREHVPANIRWRVVLITFHEEPIGDPSGVSSDQSKRPADSNESADHPVE